MARAEDMRATWGGGSGGRRRAGARSRSTFMVEALLILACLMMVLAVVMALFGFSHQRSVAAEQRQRAQSLVQNIAEQFAADPQAALDGALDGQQDGLEVLVSVVGEDRAAGRLLEATITVTCDDEVLVTLDTARYVPDGEGAAGTSGGAAVDAAGSAASRVAGRQVG